MSFAVGSLLKNMGDNPPSMFPRGPVPLLRPQDIPGHRPSQPSRNTQHLQKGDLAVQFGLQNAPNVPAPASKLELTTVFVGNITDKASDTLIRQILMKCGFIVSWKRVQGASGRLQAFGFCEYSSPEAGLRAMRLLSGVQICDKKLLVKVDSKTRSQLDHYKQVQKQKHNGGEDFDIETAQVTIDEDKRILGEIEELLKENSSVDCDILHNFKKTHSGAAENLDGLEMNDETKNLVSKEIRSFRETYKDEKKEEKEGKDGKDGKERAKSPADRDRSRDRRRSRSRDRGGRDRGEAREREREREREKEREKEKEREREREKEKEREKERERERERRRREREERERTDRKRDESRDRGGERGGERERRSTPSKRRSSSPHERDVDDEEVDRIRLEKIRRDKDNAYMERVRDWELRERKRLRELEKQIQKEEKKKEEEEEERANLLEFLEDYDDDKDDVKYYRGSALARRLRDRELEIQADSRDKQREMEEIEEILRKQMSEGSGSDLNKRIQKEVNKQTGRIVKETIDLDPKPLDRMPVPAAAPAATQLRPAPVTSAPAVEQPKQHHPAPAPAKQQPVSNGRQEPLRPTFTEQPMDDMDDSPGTQPMSSPSPAPSPAAAPSPIRMQQPTNKPNLKRDHTQENGQQEQAQPKRFGFGMKVQPVSKKIGAVFNNDDDNSTTEEPKKKLSRLDEEASVEEKRKQIKTLIEKIPTVKEDLFAYELKWDIVDEQLVEKRIKPWINKKIFEYIGEEEQTLVDFICSKVLSKSNATNILEDVAMVLDEESEVFVVKMWRLLIYETEAKCLGLVK